MVSSVAATELAFCRAERETLTGSRIPSSMMRHGGPFEQARSNMRKLMQLFDDKGLREEARHCKFLHAVWFPSVARHDLAKVNLPSDAVPETVLVNEDVFSPLESIERVFALSVPTRVETDLTERQAHLVINRVLSPSFDLFVSCTLDIDLGKHVFRRMIKEQSRIIDFLEDQPSAAITGPQERAKPYWQSRRRRGPPSLVSEYCSCATTGISGTA